MRKPLFLLLALAILLGGARQFFPTYFPAGADVAQARQQAADNTLRAAWKAHRSDVQVSGTGTVKRVLRDDTRGIRHQKFILLLPWGQSVLVAHNIDLAPRLKGLRKGDTVEFHGEYEWNDKGGVVHWTHRDPRGRHPDGWLRYRGRLYQ